MGNAVWQALASGHQGVAPCGRGAEPSAKVLRIVSTRAGLLNALLRYETPWPRGRPGGHDLLDTL